MTTKTERIRALKAMQTQTIVQHGFLLGQPEAILPQHGERTKLGDELVAFALP